MNRRSVHLRDAQAKAISEIRKESVSSDEYPEMKEAEVMRRLVDQGLEHSDLTDLVGEAATIKFRRERFKDTEGWLVNMRSGFRKRIADAFKDRFKGGWNAEELEQFAENMRQDAHILWPGERYEDDRLEAIRYIEAVVEAAVEAAETSEVDPLDPETLFDNFSGVREATERETIDQEREGETFDVLVEAAETRLERLEERGVKPNLKAMADSIAAKHGVDDQLAAEAVRDAAGQPEVPADD